MTTDSDRNPAVPWQAVGRFMPGHGPKLDRRPTMAGSLSTVRRDPDATDWQSVDWQRVAWQQRRPQMPHVGPLWGPVAAKIHGIARAWERFAVTTALVGSALPLPDRTEWVNTLRKYGGGGGYGGVGPPNNSAPYRVEDVTLQHDAGGNP
jgi:hypothetical protein